MMPDGSCRFISETIDTDDLIQPEPRQQPAPYDGRSPYGVWGALGSKRGGEPMGQFQATSATTVCEPGVCFGISRKPEAQASGFRAS